MTWLLSISCFFPDFVFQEFSLENFRMTKVILTLEELTLDLTDLLVALVHKSGYWTLLVLELVAVPTKLGGIAGWSGIMSSSNVIIPHPMSVLSYYHCMNPSYFLFKGGLADHGRLLSPKSNNLPWSDRHYFI